MAETLAGLPSTVLERRPDVLAAQKTVMAAQARVGVAQTACCAFGMERLVLALLRHHGFDPAEWPAGVRAALELA